MPRWRFRSPEAPGNGCLAIGESVTADNPPLRVQSSAWTSEFAGAKLADTDGSGAVKALDEYLRWGD